MAPGDPIETVSRFCEIWQEPDGFPRAVELYFARNTVWENHGMVTTIGPEEAIGFYRQFSEATAMARMKIDMLAIALTGNKVLTERVDWILGQDGEVQAKVQVMGIFEVIEGKIVAWREYFDTAGQGSAPRGRHRSVVRDLGGDKGTSQHR